MRIKKRESYDTPYPMNALLVDGVTATRRLEHHMLESIGIRTEPANSAQEAMQILLTGVKFDFIFVDFDLPVINGPGVSTIYLFFILLIFLFHFPHFKLTSW